MTRDKAARCSQGYQLPATDQPIDMKIVCLAVRGQLQAKLMAWRSQNCHDIDNQQPVVHLYGGLEVPGGAARTICR